MRTSLVLSAGLTAAAACWPFVLASEHYDLGLLIETNPVDSRYYNADMNRLIRKGVLSSSHVRLSSEYRRLGKHRHHHTEHLEEHQGPQSTYPRSGNQYNGQRQRQHQGQSQSHNNHQRTSSHNYDSVGAYDPFSGGLADEQADYWDDDITDDWTDDIVVEEDFTDDWVDDDRAATDAYNDDWENRYNIDEIDAENEEEDIEDVERDQGEPSSQVPSPAPTVGSTTQDEEDSDDVLITQLSFSGFFHKDMSSSTVLNPFGNVEQCGGSSGPRTSPPNLTMPPTAAIPPFETSAPSVSPTQLPTSRGTPAPTNSSGLGTLTRDSETMGDMDGTNDTEAPSKETEKESVGDESLTSPTAAPTIGVAEEHEHNDKTGLEEGDYTSDTVAPSMPATEEVTANYTKEPVELLESVAELEGDQANGTSSAAVVEEEIVGNGDAEEVAGNRSSRRLSGSNPEPGTTFVYQDAPLEDIDELMFSPLMGLVQGACKRTDCFGKAYCQLVIELLDDSGFVALSFNAEGPVENGRNALSITGGQTLLWGAVGQVLITPGDYSGDPSNPSVETTEDQSVDFLEGTDGYLLEIELMLDERYQILFRDG